jgi:hypothetical protein
MDSARFLVLTPKKQEISFCTVQTVNMTGFVPSLVQRQNVDAVRPEYHGVP